MDKWVDGVLQTKTYNEKKQPKKKESNKGVCFCFTDFLPYNVSNGYSDIYVDFKDVIRGIAWGKEVCPTTGKEHNQGYIQLFVQDRYSVIQKWFKSKCNFRVMKGSILQNEEYCSKEGSYTKLGKFVSRGYRSDAHNIKDDIVNGASEKEIMENYTGNYLRYHSGIKSIKSLHDKDARNCWMEPNVTALVGLGGGGKSTYVYNKHGYNNCFTIDSKMMATDFWGMYAGEEVLIIDDFNGWIQYSYLLRILDGHPLHLNIKNGNTFKNWKFVYMTSNVLPKCWYANIKWNLMRRFKICLLVSKGNTENLTHQEAWGKNYNIFKKQVESDLSKEELLCLLDNSDNYCD